MKIFDPARISQAFPNILILFALIPVLLFLRSIVNKDLIDLLQLIIAVLGFWYVIKNFDTQQKQISEQREITNRQLIESGFKVFTDSIQRAVEHSEGKRHKLEVIEQPKKLTEVELKGHVLFSFMYDQMRDLHRTLTIDIPNITEVYEEYNRVITTFDYQLIAANYQYRQSHFLFEFFEVKAEQVQEYRATHITDKAKFILDTINSLDGNELVHVVSNINHAIIYLTYHYDKETENADDAKTKAVRHQFLNYILALKSVIPKPLLLYYFYMLIRRREVDSHFVYSLLFSDIKPVELLDEAHGRYLPMVNYFPEIMEVDNNLEHTNENQA